MKRELSKTHLALGVLNLVACVFMLILFLFQYSNVRTAFAFFSYALPFMAGAIATLISGIFTLKGKNWIWTVMGLVFSAAGFIYFLILVWIVLWSAQ